MKKPSKKTTKTNTRAPRAASARHKNHCKTVILIAIIALIVCVVCAGGVAIFCAIKNQKTSAHISNFSLIADNDVYNTIAMNDDYLEVMASDWGDPAIERQIRINLQTGDTQAVIHYGQNDSENCNDSNNADCAIDEVYYGKLSSEATSQVKTDAAAILADQSKLTFTLNSYNENEALVELCQSIIKTITEN